MVIALHDPNSTRTGTSIRTATPQQRIVVLGASNVARSFARIVSIAQRTWDAPVEVMAAFGHGRSYGCDSRVLGRKISGILSCGLWEELARRPALPTFALITDIGNDILYGRSPNQLLDWVAESLDRLRLVGAKVVITELPLESLAQLGSARFALLRAILFPSSRLALNVAKAHAEAVNMGLVDLAELKKVAVFSVRNEWYGFDPIHIRRSRGEHAWAEILATWSAPQLNEHRARRTIWQTAYVRSLPPLERSLWGLSQCRAQPSGILSDGSTISLY